MSFIYGTTGSVTWGTGFNAALVASTHTPSSFGLTIDGDTFDTTRFGSAISARNTGGLRSWSGSITVYQTVPVIGCGGYVTLGTYDAFLNEWNLSMQAAFANTTVFAGGTCPQWKTFIPGVYSWGGTLGGFVDSATVIPLPMIDETAPEDPTAITLRATTASYLSGNVFVNNSSIGVDVNNVITYSSSFVGDSTLTAASTEIFAAGAVIQPVAESLVLTSSTGKTYTGSAFWTSINIRNKVDEINEMTINFQGTGALTLA